MVLPPYATHSGSLEALIQKQVQHTVQMQCLLESAVLDKHSIPALMVAMPGAISNTTMDGARLGQKLASL